MPSREPELYKDKIEVNLDGRHIFYLFFGGSIIVGLVFVLGVMVGRRVEARGHVDHARTTPTADPLAALDNLESDAKPSLSFQGALASGTQGTSDVERAIDEHVRPAKGRPSKPDAKSAKPPAKADPARPEPANPDVAQADDKKKKAEAKSRFTLQLSSFQDKQEAQSFLSSVRAAGYQAYVTEAEVDGKGVFYRVRLGSYRSLDAANDAKSDVEKALKKSASVMRL